MKITRLENNIQHLQDEILELQLKHQLVSLEPANKNSWCVVVEYFQLYRFGVKPSASDAIMQSWKHVSLCFNGLQVEITSLENGLEDSAIVTTKQNLTISQNVLQYTFPHLIHGEGESSQLETKLLGQQIVIQGSVHFKWDSENRRVSSFAFKIDMVTSMLDLLGNLEDISRVFKNSCLTPEFGIVTES
ncbi:hypothetical protein PHMEG_00026274 [Phytophthora megakarya]|uniref:Bzip transcription factor n=1 Tax=Phytophthora megakarya TaxID=4795 RepID=A0A225VA38_9STRA|nr:hypothetical protein PHMEG_00026274 [Phytophthora megakarya]